MRIELSEEYVLPVVEMIDLRSIVDQRGSLVPLEEGDVGYPINRIYYMYGVNGDRGFHAHKRLKQTLIAVSGSIDVVCETLDGDKKTYKLDTPTKALRIDGLVWHYMTNFSKDGLLLVLASEPYDESDYVRDYEKFENLKEYV